MPGSDDEAVLLRCDEDGSALILVSWPKGNLLAVCPECGKAGKYEQIAEQSARLVTGLLSEKKLADLRKQLGLAGD